MRKYHLGLIPTCLVFLLLASSALSQTEKGSIVGTVTDVNGGVVADAIVTVTQLGNKTSQTFTTNSDGVYNAPFLNPGNYEVSATATGFSKTLVTNVVVPVG